MAPIGPVRSRYARRTPPAQYDAGWLNQELQNIERGIPYATTVDVRDCGITGQPSATDDANFRRAINALPASGGVIFIPPAFVLRIEAPLTEINTKQHVTILGTGELLSAANNVSGTATVYCKDVTGYLFPITPDTSLQSFALIGVAFDAANGEGFASASTTCRGLFQNQQVAADFSALTVATCFVQCFGVDGADCLDLTNTINPKILNTQFAFITLGRIARFQGNTATATTARFHTCYFHYCREIAYQNGVNMTDIAFHDCIFESSGVAYVAFWAHALFDNCYFENIGYSPWSLTPVSKQSAGSAIGAPYSTAAVNTVFNIVYGQATFVSCTFVPLSPTDGAGGASLVSGWLRGLGKASSDGLGGSARFIGCRSGDTHQFFVGDLADTGRATFTYDVDNGGVAGIGVLQLYADARRVNHGVALIPFPASVYRLAEIRRGQFTYGAGSDETYTAWLADQPTGGQNEVGDRVTVTAPVSTGYSGYVCTTAGSPGTGKGYGAIA